MADSKSIVVNVCNNDYKIILKDNKYNVLDTNDYLVLEKWYDNITFNDKVNNFTICEYEKYNAVDLNGNILFDYWADSLIYNDDIDMFSIIINNHCNLIKSDGTLYFKEWLVGDGIWKFNDNFFLVNFSDYTQFLIDHNGKRISRPFYWFTKLKNGFIKAKTFYGDNTVHLYNDKFELLNDEGYEEFYDYSEGIAKVKRYKDSYRNAEYNFVDINGKLLSPKKWFKDAEDFKDGIAKVKCKNRRYYIHKNGKLTLFKKPLLTIFKKWFS